MRISEAKAISPNTWRGYGEKNAVRKAVFFVS
uniref:Uncharacterized protein n=1 Tax=Siphoviridae sp. ct1SN28 TaxID=2825308 RepID=A0A8S5TRN4_9CAUD|nr:MAG TPA: hypothetical protein [Siphoviridae sp. ct1SN28]